MKGVKKTKGSDARLGGNLKLTIPDLIVLSLLIEQPMHGYDVNATLEERNIRDWAPVSRPQIYYSLDKLLRLKLTRLARDEEPAAGPERRVFQTTSKGREQLADALDAKHWVEDKVYQPFLIWLALSWQAPPDIFKKQIQTRKALLIDRISEERKTLKEVLREVGHQHHEAVWMIKLFIEQVEVEIKWIDRIMATWNKRAPARRPRIA